MSLKGFIGLCIAVFFIFSLKDYFRSVRGDITRLEAEMLINARAITLIVIGLLYSIFRK